MEILYTALLMGLMGSFHCVGMCGPIALSLPLRGNSPVQRIFGGILYNLGRTITYGLIGGLFGFIGQGFHFLGFQQWISIVMGALMIVSILLPSLFKQARFSDFIPFTSSVRKGIQRLFRERSYSGLFLIGVLNGLLPCGLVYMAVAGAIGTGNALMGVAFMVLFGLGTLPLMLLVSILGNWISTGVRNRINKVIPYLVVVIGLIFILRGLSLGIPYLSPPKEKLNPIAHQKIQKCDSISTTMEHSCCHGKK